MTIMVTGGGGFLGGALLRALKERGLALRTINRGSYPQLDALNIEVLRGDLADYPTTLKALEGVEAVFHVAAKPGVWGPYEDYYAANVVATQNIVKACRALGIKKLVYTSSPSVSFAGVDQENTNESTPYPTQYLAAYPQTKAEAERFVLEANDNSLATVALRPHLIWGPGDPNLVPRVIDRARKGRLRLVGDASKLVDAVYIDNAVEAHLCAFDRLSIGSVPAGKVYFIGNAEPWPMEKIINNILAAASLPPENKRLTFKKAWFIAILMEKIYGFFGITKEPPLTRFVVAQLNTAHWYDPSAARNDLGYVPKVSMKAGFERLKKSLATL